MTLRIAVLTDQHIDTVANKKSWSRAQRAFRIAADAQPDHVVIAGDLFDCSTAMRRDHPKVERALRDVGLWDAEKLTIIPGNHDIFHTPHHGSLEDRLLEWTRISLEDASEMYDEFCRWVSPLTPANTRVASAVYPNLKDLGGPLLVAVDTTGPDTRSSSNGCWGDDEMLRAKLGEGAMVVVASHHAPFKSKRANTKRVLRDLDTPLGFPKAHYRRLVSFADDVGVAAWLCGHVHDRKKRKWTIGKRPRVILEGRTGGVGVAARLSIVEMPRTAGPDTVVRRSTRKLRP